MCLPGNKVRDSLCFHPPHPPYLIFFSFPSTLSAIEKKTSNTENREAGPACPRGTQSLELPSTAPEACRSPRESCLLWPLGRFAGSEGGSRLHNKRSSRKELGWRAGHSACLNLLLLLLILSPGPGELGVPRGHFWVGLPQPCLPVPSIQPGKLPAHCQLESLGECQVLFSYRCAAGITRD